MGYYFHHSSINGNKIIIVVTPALLYWFGIYYCRPIISVLSQVFDQAVTYKLENDMTGRSEMIVVNLDVVMAQEKSGFLNWQKSRNYSGKPYI